GDPSAGAAALAGGPFFLTPSAGAVRALVWPLSIPLKGDPRSGGPAPGGGDSGGSGGRKIVAGEVLAAVKFIVFTRPLPRRRRRLHSRRRNRAPSARTVRFPGRAGSRCTAGPRRSPRCRRRARVRCCHRIRSAFRSA